MFWILPDIRNWEQKQILISLLLRGQNWEQDLITIVEKNQENEYIRE